MERAKPKCMGLFCDILDRKTGPTDCGLSLVLNKLVINDKMRKNSNAFIGFKAK